MSDLNKTVKKQANKYYLWWINERTHQRYLAGMAYHDDDLDEYLLKINCFPRRRLYLKKYTTKDKEIFFRVEESKWARGRYIRDCVGDAHLGLDDTNDVEMTILPHFAAKLVLAL